MFSTAVAAALVLIFAWLGVSLIGLFSGAHGS